MFSQVTGWAQAMLEVLEIPDVTAPIGLKRLWNLLNDVFQKLAHKRLLDDVLQRGKQLVEKLRAKEQCRQEGMHEASRGV